MVDTAERTYGPRVRVEFENGSARIHLYDELVAGDVDDLRTAVEDVTESAHEAAGLIDIEMQDLDYIDRAGIAALAKLAVQEAHDARSVRVRHPSPPVNLVLRLAGLTKALHLGDDDSPSRRATTPGHN